MFASAVLIRIVPAASPTPPFQIILNIPRVERLSSKSDGCFFFPKLNLLTIKAL